jgi:hypothetical protein
MLEEVVVAACFSLAWHFLREGQRNFMKAHV